MNPPPDSVIVRVYRPLNPGDVDPDPRQSTRAQIKRASHVREWLERTGQKAPDGIVTVTFIVDLGGCLWIADRHSEHIACAGGKAVLSAGEVAFDVTKRVVTVSGISNQSLGYCPEPTSWPATALALEQAGIEHPGHFTAEFVFRRCTQCGQTNIVKDEWYQCAVCDAPLSREWNLSRWYRETLGKS